MKKLITVAILLVFFEFSCHKPDQYPDVPTLTFKSLTFSKDAYGSSLFTLIATFTDGDGDVGYNQGDHTDPNDPYNSNYVIALQRLKNGAWTDTLHYHFLADTVYHDSIYRVSWRLPYLTPDGQNKGLKGDIEQTAELPLGLNDTIRFTAFLYDRALHKSNTIIVPENGGYFIQTQ